MNRKFDIFISYASEVKPIAVEVEEKLSVAGLKVFRDDNSIKWGDDIVKVIARGLSESRGYVLILNEDFYKKGFTTNELSAAFMLFLKSFGENQRHIFALLLDDYAKQEWQSFAFSSHISAIDIDKWHNNYVDLIKIIKDKLMVSV
jgi:hypothetical protein